MKPVLCLVVLTFAIVHGKRTFVTVPEENVPIVLKASADCISKHGVDADTLNRIITWNVEDTESFRKFLYCFAKTTGYADNEGHIITEKMTKLVGNNKKKAEFENAINECNKLKGSDKYETMFKTGSCFQKTSPILFKL